MPTLFAFGPTPQISSMLLSISILVAAAYACWHQLRVLKRGPLVIASATVFASLVTTVLPHSDWGKVVMPYLLAEDFETAAKQTEKMSRAMLNPADISQFAVVLAARSGDRQLHHQLHQQFLDQVARLEERYDPWRAPTQLEALFVCPAKLANPVAACQRPSPVHGELNLIRKGVAGQRWGLKEAIGGRWNVA